MKGRQQILRRYQQVSVLTASAEQLIIALIDEALSSIHTARQAMEKEEVAEQNQHLQRAQECVLQVIPFIEAGKEQGQALIAVYDYLNRQLVKANMANDRSALGEIADFLGKQKEDWQLALHRRRKKHTEDFI